MTHRSALLAALAAAALAAGCGPPQPDGDASWRVQRLSPKWKWIVIHHSATESGCFARFDKFHRENRGWENGCGYHFVIGNGTDTEDGRVEVTPRWRRQLHGAHVGGERNNYCIGICLVGNFEDTRPTRAQMDALVRLVAYLQETCGIRRRRVVGHKFFKPTTQCPGARFPWPTLRQRLKP